MPAAKPPSIYENMAQMSGPGGAPPPSPDAKGGAGGSGAKPGDMEEKKKIITTLLEVFKKMDLLETDPKGKDLISQMVKMAEQYDKEILKSDGAGPAGAGGPSEGAPPPPPPGGMKKEEGVPVPA